MITKYDLEAAIAECQGKRNPDSKTCIMLAAFYTIRREMFGEEKPDYSFAPAPDRSTVSYTSDTEFARAIKGMTPDQILPVMDELMTALEVIQPRLYSAVLDKLA